MNLKNVDVQRLINELKGLDGMAKSMAPRSAAKSILGLTPADIYDIRYIGKPEAKKLTRNELESLIEYGAGYLRDCESGKYMIYKDRRGMDMADFAETISYQEVKRSMSFLNQEYTRRMYGEK